MTAPSSPTHALALHLFNIELPENSDAGDSTGAVRLVFDKLNAELEPLIGRVGYQTLVARVLRLTSRDYPELAEVECRSGMDPGLVGLYEVLKGKDPGEVRAVGAAIITQLLDLISNFIGENLTVRLVSQAWPDLPATLMKSISGGER